MVHRETRSPAMFMTDAGEMSLNLHVEGACWEVVLQSRDKSPTLKLHQLSNQRNNAYASAATVETG